MTPEIILHLDPKLFDFVHAVSKSANVFPASTIRTILALHAYAPTLTLTSTPISIVPPNKWPDSPPHDSLVKVAKHTETEQLALKFNYLFQNMLTGLSADLESGSHHLNNAASEQFVKKHPYMSAAMDEMSKAIDELMPKDY